MNIMQKVSFDDVENIKLSVEEFLDIPPVPVQRDTLARSKKPAVKRALSILKQVHLEVAIAELLKDCTYYGVKYKKGWRGVVNGNTRALFWKTGKSDKIPTTVNVTTYFVNTMEEARDIYNTYDSPDATESRQEKLYGIINGLYDYDAISSKVQKGQILTALNLACYYFDPVKYGSKTTSRVIKDLPFVTKEYIEEIKAFDKICTSDTYWDQALVCAALMSLKRYGTNNAKLLDCLVKIDGCYAKNDKINSPVDGITHITMEWNSKKRFPVRRTSWQKSGGLFQTVPFLLYWIEKWMSDKVLSQTGKNWETTATTWFNEFHTINTSLSTLMNISNEIEKEFLITS